MNELILSKMKDLQNLEQKSTDLFDTVKLLQEENHLLKEASKYSSMIELSQSKIKDIPSDKNNNNTNNNKVKNINNIKWIWVILKSIMILKVK